MNRVVALSLGLGLLLASCGGTLAQLQQSYQAQRSYEGGLHRYRARDFAGSIPWLQRALILDPSFDDAQAYLAWSYYYTGKYPEATLHFRRALSRQPKWEGLYDALGWSRYRVGSPWRRSGRL